MNTNGRDVAMRSAIATLQQLAPQLADMGTNQLVPLNLFRIVAAILWLLQQLTKFADNILQIII